MLSEVSWERPSRFRGEAPLALAAYGALQQTDAILHFRVESTDWATQIRGTPTPWPLTTPGQLGQFPAAALVFRRALVSPGGVVARVVLRRADLLDLRGTPLPDGASLPESERSEVVADGRASPDQRLDPLLHLAGRIEVEFTDGPSMAVASPPRGLVEPCRTRVRSTNGELALDYGAGLLVVDAPQAQGGVGALGSRSQVDTADLSISSTMETGTIIVVSLDGRSLAVSERMLLQVMSEERAMGFSSESTAHGRRRILDPGREPWQIREIRGSVAPWPSLAQTPPSSGSPRSILRVVRCDRSATLVASSSRQRSSTTSSSVDGSIPGSPAQGPTSGHTVRRSPCTTPSVQTHTVP